MSLDGLRENHDKNRKEGSFDATLRFTMLVLSQAQELPYHKKIFRIFPGLIDLCAEYRVGDFAFTRYAPNGGDKNSIAPYSTVMVCRRTEDSILSNIFSDSIEELQQVKSCCRDINLYEG